MYKNDIVKFAMCNEYHRMTAADKEVYCFTRQKNVWAVQVSSSSALLYEITYLEKRGNGDICLKFRPNRKQQDFILANAERVEILCTVDFLESENQRQTKKNRGDIVEQLASEKWGGVQPADRATKFTDCGDFSVDSIQFQVKYGASTGAATITTERTLKNLGR